MESSPAFLYGESVFTSSRARQGKLFFKRPHLERLFHAVEDYYLGQALDESQKLRIQKKIDDFLEDLDEHDYRVRIMVFSKNRPTLLPASFDFNDLELMCEATKLQVNNSPVSLMCFQTPFSAHYPNIKMGSYMPLLRLKLLANREGADDALLVDNETIIEASTSNIFFLRNERIFSPNRFLLNGVIKQSLENFMDVESREINLEALESFDGAFLTNSCNIVRPISSINKIKYTKSYQNLLDKINEDLLQRGFSEKEN